MFNKKKIGAFIITSGLLLGAGAGTAAAEEPAFGSSDFDIAGFINSLFTGSSGDMGGSTNIGGSLNIGGDNYDAHDMYVTYSNTAEDFTNHFFTPRLNAKYRFGELNAGQVLQTDLRTVISDEENSDFTIPNHRKDFTIADDGHTLIFNSNTMVDGRHYTDGWLFVVVKSEKTGKEYQGEVRLNVDSNTHFVNTTNLKDFVPAATVYGRDGQRANILAPKETFKRLDNVTGDLTYTTSTKSPTWLNVDADGTVNVDLRHAYRGAGSYKTFIDIIGGNGDKVDAPYTIFVGSMPKYNIFVHDNTPKNEQQNTTKRGNKTPGNRGPLLGSADFLNEFSKNFEADDFDTLERKDLVNEGLLDTDKLERNLFRDTGGNAYEAYKIREKMDKRNARYGKIDKTVEALDRTKNLLNKLDAAEKKIEGKTTGGEKTRPVADTNTVKVVAGENTTNPQTVDVDSTIKDGAAKVTVNTRDTANKTVTTVVENGQKVEVETTTNNDRKTVPMHLENGRYVPDEKPEAATPPPATVYTANKTTNTPPEAVSAPAATKTSLPDTGANVGLLGMLSGLMIAAGIGILIAVRKAVAAR